MELNVPTDIPTTFHIHLVIRRHFCSKALKLKVEVEPCIILLIMNMNNKGILSRKKNTVIENIFHKITSVKKQMQKHIN